MYMYHCKMLIRLILKLWLTINCIIMDKYVKISNRIFFIVSFKVKQTDSYNKPRLNPCKQ